MVYLDMSVLPMPASTNDNRGLDGARLFREKTMVPAPGPVDVVDDCFGQGAYRDGTGVPWSTSITVTSIWP